MIAAQVLALTLLALPAQQRPNDCVANPAQVVDDIYQQVLERPADPASAGLTQALGSGRMTVREIVAQVAKSEEHTRRFYWEPIVSSVYRQVLGREANAEELRHGAEMLSTDRMRMPDFVARTATRAANNQQDAVRILYKRLLGREPDAAGLEWATGVAERSGIDALARDIVASPEYRRRVGAGGLPTEDMAAYEAAARSVYRHVLGRDPDPAGLRNLTQMAATRGIESAIDRMISSREYLQEFGTNRVPGRDIQWCGPSRRSRVR
jgi:Phycobilisome Linker polypeptide